MNQTEKDVIYQNRNSYSTLNSISSKTKNIWFVIHGIGYLSKNFIRYFEMLNPEENYIIAPQAPAKYYLGFDFKKVGACWLTKENTENDVENVMSYLDAIYKTENIPPHLNLIVLGYSQGVSVVTRWVTRRKIKCYKMILYAGGIPVELTAKDFVFLNDDETRVVCIYGDKDPYIGPQRLKEEELKIQEIFGSMAEIYLFEGGHEFRNNLLLQWIPE